MKARLGMNKWIVFGLVFSLLLGGFSTAQANPGDSPVDLAGGRGDSTGGAPDEIAPFEVGVPDGVADSERLGDTEPIRDPDDHRKLLEKYGYPIRQTREIPGDEDAFTGDDSRNEVIPPPLNDDMSLATPVPPGLPYIDVVDTSGATVEGAEPAWYCGSGVGGTVWYRYTPVSSGFFVIDTFGSNFDTVLLVVLDGSLTPVGCNDQSNYTDQSQVVFEGISGTTYLIGVGGWLGDSGSMQINIREIGAFTNCSEVDVTRAECRALRNLYLATGGEFWTRSAGWLETNEVCTWEGIICNGVAVEVLSLYNNNMVGALSADLTGLGSLVELDFGNNSLSGDMSAIAGNLPTNITYLIMFMNNFTGTLPAQLLSFPNLEIIDLAFNFLSGDLSTAMGYVPLSVTYLTLYVNDFTGTVPDLASFTNLRVLGIGHNLLAGEIASVIDNMPSGIEGLYLEYNDFTGMIPAAAAGLSSLEDLNVTGNQLDGDLAASMANLPTSIQYAYIGNNDFHGTIPASVSSLVNLKTLEIAYNDGLIGTIPVEIATLLLYEFNFEGTYLCEPADAGYLTWKATVTVYTPGYCGAISQDFIIEYIASWPTVPAPGEGFDIVVYTRNIGGEVSSAFWTDVYIDRYPGSPSDLGDYRLNTGPLEPGERRTIFFSATGLSEGIHGVAAYVDLEDLVAENDDGNNHYGAVTLKVSNIYFESYFEGGTFDEWSRFNDGKGFLYPCHAAGMTGSWGACVERGTNDKRKQLIDETPIFQKAFNVSFGFDINGLTMGAGERFRFMQVKMGAERPFFIVLKYQGGNYLIQLNTLLDDLTKVKTGWYVLSDAPHVIEVGWEAASAPAANDGSATLYLDHVALESLTGLDNDTIYVDSYKTGFTSRLVGKSISGIFYLDDVLTSRTGYIGAP